MTDATPTRRREDPPDDSRLVEVWGDTVDERHVKIAVALGVVLSVPSFLGAKELFASVMDNQDLAKTYAMLTGLAACLVAAVISARLFEPKRVVTERQLDPEEQIAAAMELAQLPLGLGTLDSLSPAEQDEMRRLGLYDVFAEVERRLADDPTNDLSPTDASGTTITEERHA